jgi:hypothetical protein
MPKIRLAQRPLRIRALGMLLPILISCAGGAHALAGMSDWSTLDSGQGTVETRVVNDSSEPITVRIQDEGDKVVGQAPLPPHGAETLNLPVGPVHATVRVKRDGRLTYSDPQPFQVAPGHDPAAWHFTAPTIE